MKVLTTIDSHLKMGVIILHRCVLVMEWILGMKINDSGQGTKARSTPWSLKTSSAMYPYSVV